jgi:hypothetical protein
MGINNEVTVEEFFKIHEEFFKIHLEKQVQEILEAFYAKVREKDPWQENKEDVFVCFASTPQKVQKAVVDNLKRNGWDASEGYAGEVRVSSPHPEHQKKS